MNANRIRPMLSILAVGAALLLAYAGAGDLGAPHLNGALSAKHASLAGACEKCHTPWKGVSDASCDECHLSLAHTKDGGRMPRCHHCHREHNGEGGDPLFVGDRACAPCHASGLRAHAARPGPDKPRVLRTHARFFKRGVFDEKACRRCHEDETFRDDKDKPVYVRDQMHFHMKELSLTCGACHEPVRMEGFTATGGEVKFDGCVACHVRNGKNVSCGSCHLFHAL